MIFVIPIILGAAALASAAYGAVKGVEGVSDIQTAAQIEAQRDCIIQYLERSFDERSENFRRLFAVVDQAIAAGSNEQLALALHSITELAKSSPFKELANLASVEAALEDPNYEWQF